MALCIFYILALLFLPYSTWVLFPNHCLCPCVAVLFSFLLSSVPLVFPSVSSSDNIPPAALFYFFSIDISFFYPQPFRLCIVLHLCKFKWVNHKTTSGASDIKLKLYQLYVKGLGNRSKETHFPAPQTRPDYRKTLSHSLFVISEQ